MSELRATYRLQLGPGLRFGDVAGLAPYLRELGVSHLYLSPSLQARSGSTHGYDVVDPTRVSEELGGEEALRALAGTGLGIILDIVPNHMGADDENRWWADESRRAEVFDVDPETGFCRRFFDIDDLAAVRQERPEVFDLTHRKILELVADGVLDGVRVDHPDGLSDPAGYLRRLRDRGARHVWVEKILHPGEPLRDWPVDGTVGYDFLNDAQALFVDPEAEGPLTELYAELTGETRSFARIAFEAQLEQANTVFTREIDWLRRLGPGLPGVPEALAALPVYRTYVEPWSGRVDELDRAAVAEAHMPQELARVLLLEQRGFDEFVTRFQQTSPPVTAKGIEDTAFYRYNRLLALNEVGGDPSRFGIGVDEMHRANLQRAERFPRNLLITSTHDTKRSADVRARIGALASLHAELGPLLRRWYRLAEPLRRDGAPDANELWLIFQTLLGAWPIGIERLEAYLEKALREGKVNTSWIDPDDRHEAAVKAFARRVVEHPELRPELDAFCEKVGGEGRRSALGQLLLKLTAPGVPDVYGGDEIEFRALVDPDNRRPVDWDERRRALEGVRAGGAPRVEHAKLLLIQRALSLRHRRAAAFAGGYEAVEAGPGVCAYTRGDGEVLVVVPVRDWAGAKLRLDPALHGRWTSALDGSEHNLGSGAPVAELTGALGIALLERA